ncbi:hypothetical protein CIW54_04275 [Paraburkholderia sp. T12-10]|nr:hypothetical protein CIW54_04275 [Paraburkholderia sp. T12-10]
MIISPKTSVFAPFSRKRLRLDDGASHVRCAQP